MIFVGIGSNLAAPGYSSPQNTAEASLAALPGIGTVLCARSSWYGSEPVPASDQPWFINAVVEIGTELPAPELLARLLALEARFGRERSVPDAARTLDLDLLDYDGFRCSTPDLVLPHPRLHERRFVLTVAELLARLPPGQAIRRLTDSTEKSR